MNVPRYTKETLFAWDYKTVFIEGAYPIYDLGKRVFKTVSKDLVLYVYISDHIF